MQCLRGHFHSFVSSHISLLGFLAGLIRYRKTLSCRLLSFSAGLISSLSYYPGYLSRGSNSFITSSNSRLSFEPGFFGCLKSSCGGSLGFSSRLFSLYGCLRRYILSQISTGCSGFLDGFISLFARGDGRCNSFLNSLGS